MVEMFRGNGAICSLQCSEMSLNGREGFLYIVITQCASNYICQSSIEDGVFIACRGWSIKVSLALMILELVLIRFHL